MTALNKNTRVRLTEVDNRLHSFGLHKNQEGTVISTRHLKTDTHLQVLVDFDGRTGRVSLRQDQVKAISHPDHTYLIQINEEQRELISRALDHLYEVDIQYHDDLITDKFYRPGRGRNRIFKGLRRTYDKGKDLYYLYKMFSTNDLEQDGGLFSGDMLNGLCYD